MTRQHNEPAGGQDIWHYHVHVTPRFEGDRFYEDRDVPFPEAERIAFAERLRKCLQNPGFCKLKSQVE